MEQTPAPPRPAAPADDEIPAQLALPQGCLAEINACIEAFEAVVGACMAGRAVPALPDTPLPQLHGYLLSTLGTYALPEMVYHYRGYYYQLSPYYGPTLKLGITKLCCVNSQP